MTKRANRVPSSGWHALPAALWLLALSAGCGDDVKVTTSTNNATGSCSCPLSFKFTNLAVCESPDAGSRPAHVYSTSIDAGVVSCDPYQDPQPTPSAPWGNVDVTSSCGGTGSLCVTAFGGDLDQRSADDCVLASVCTEISAANQSVSMSTLPGWSTTNGECAARKEQVGGYLEFRLNSPSLGCDAGLGDQITRLRICPAACTGVPIDAGIAACKQCNSGAPAATF